MTGKAEVVVVTGASAGLGRAIARVSCNRNLMLAGAAAAVLAFAFRGKLAKLR